MKKVTHIQGHFMKQVKTKVKIKKKTIMEIPLFNEGGLITVNVIEMEDRSPIQLKSFPDNKQGNLDAEDFFVAIMKENIHNFHEYTQKDIDTTIEQGYEHAGTWSAFLTHSN